VSGQTVFTGHFTARNKALVFIELEAGWVLELVCIYWRGDSSLAPTKIRNPGFAAYILVAVLIRLTHTVEGNTEVHINNMRWEFGVGGTRLMTGILGKLL